MRLFKYCLIPIVIFLQFGISFAAEEVNKPLIQMTPDEIFDEPEVANLAYASINGDIGKIEQILRSDIDINSKGYLGVTALFVAIRPDNIDTFKYLLENGANPDSLVAHNLSPTHLSASIADDRFLKLSLEFGANPNLLAADGLTTPLISAVSSSRSHINNTKLLIRSGADIEHKSSLNRTPLLRAAGMYRYDIVYELIRAGANMSEFYGAQKRDLAYLLQTSNPGPFNTQVHKQYRDKVVDLLIQQGYLPENFELNH